jgi:hypothetical protein
VMYKRIAKEKECERLHAIYMPRAKRSNISEVKTLRVTDHTVTVPPLQAARNALKVLLGAKIILPSLSNFNWELFNRDSGQFLIQ